MPPTVRPLSINIATSFMSFFLLFVHLASWCKNRQLACADIFVVLLLVVSVIIGRRQAAPKKKKLPDLSQPYRRPPRRLANKFIRCASESLELARPPAPEPLIGADEICDARDGNGDGDDCKYDYLVIGTSLDQIGAYRRRAGVALDSIWDDRVQCLGSDGIRRPVIDSTAGSREQVG